MDKLDRVAVNSQQLCRICLLSDAPTMQDALTVNGGAQEPV